VLDRLLVDAGADIVYGIRIAGLERTDAGRVVGVVLEDRDGNVHHIAAQVVVGADGLQSTVARLIGALPYRQGRHASATMYAHWSGLQVEGYGWYFAQGLSAAAIPTNGGQVCVSVSVPAPVFAREFTSSADRGFPKLLSQVAPSLAEQISHADLPVRIHGFAGHVGFFRQASGPGWALVGDAGYFKDPLTAHGITDALRDAEFLSSAIDAGSDEALARYQEQRDAASVDLFEATDAIASFEWDLEEVRRLHEALAKAMSREVKMMTGGVQAPANASVMR
jgi:flavin-dependent dehydrogenase